MKRTAASPLHECLPPHSPRYVVRSFVPNLFLFVLVPSLLVFLLGITRLGLQGQHIGIGGVQTLSLSLGRFVNNSAPLVWADETSASGFNASQVIASLPGLGPGSAVTRVATSAEVTSFCQSTTCFAGVVFADPNGGADTTRNYTVMYPANAVSLCEGRDCCSEELLIWSGYPWSLAHQSTMQVPYGFNVETSGGLAAIGILQLQAALDRALVAQAFPGLSDAVLNGGISVQSFTSISVADFNSAVYGFCEMVGEASSMSVTFVASPLCQVQSTTSLRRPVQRHSQRYLCRLCSGLHR